MLYVVIDHLKQLEQCLGIIVGIVNRCHLVIDAAALIGHFQGGVRAEHIGIAANRAVIPQLMEQLQKGAAVARNCNIFIKVLAALFFEPPFAV